MTSAALLSGSAAPDVQTAGRWFGMSAATMTVVAAPEHATHRRAILPSAWNTAIKTFAVATLPFAELYTLPPRQRPFETGSQYVIMLSDEFGSQLVAMEPDSVTTFSYNRPTLWLIDSVPILPPRRSFIPPLDAAAEEE